MTHLINIKNKRYFIATIIVTFLAVVVNAFIIMQSCLNGIQSTESSSFAVNLFKGIINAFKTNTINETNIDEFSHVIRKLVGHFGLFVASGIFTTWALYLWINFRSWYKHTKELVLTLAFGFFLAGLTELIQLTVPNRSGQFDDVLLDFAGYMVGTAVVVIIKDNVFKKKPSVYLRG